MLVLGALYQEMKLMLKDLKLVICLLLDLSNNSKLVISNKHIRKKSWIASKYYKTC